MTSKIMKAVEMIMEETEKEFGEDFKVGDGDVFTGVFEDGIIKIELENGKFNIDVSLGKPRVFDISLDMLGETE